VFTSNHLINTNSFDRHNYLSYIGRLVAQYDTVDGMSANWLLIYWRDSDFPTVTIVGISCFDELNAN